MRYINKFSTTLSAWVENLGASGRSSKQAVSIVADGTTAILALWLAYSLRHGQPFSDFRSTWYIFLTAALITVTVFMGLGVYRWVVRSTNLNLVRQLIKGAAISCVALIVFAFLFPPDRITPRSLFFIYGALLFIGTGAMRAIWRSLFDTGASGQPVAIYGAGSSGRQLAHSIGAGAEFRPVLFIDDSPTLAASTVSGIPVVSGSDLVALEQDIKAFEVGRIIMAMPSLAQDDYRAKLDQVKELKLPVSTVPGMAEILSGSHKVEQIRDVSIKDILGRNEVLPDPEAVASCVRDQSVLVTGGGGSIGSELCRQIHLLGAKRLVVLDHSEENLYHITEELDRVTAARTAAGEPVAEFVPVLCSVKDERRIRDVIDKNDVNTIYHAAAYKHVPIIERQPQQGIETNVFGTKTVLDAAVEAGVKNFTLISTDKAVRPTNAMGASKRVAELVLQAKAREEHSTRISMVRFGNVLGSSGSVVPKFKEQIRQGGPITITHPDITRYFMTIPEAAQLVLQASAIAKGGDVFVLDMGEPVKILDLAKTMVALSGAKLTEDTGKKSDIDIVFEGLRPGEKMFEELFITDNRQTTIEKVFSANESWLSPSELDQHLEQLLQYVADDDDVRARALLLSLAFTGSENEEQICDAGGQERFDETHSSVAGISKDTVINF